MFANLKCIEIFFISFMVVAWQEPQLVNYVEIPIALKLKHHVKVGKPHVYLSDVSSCVGPEQICSESYGIEILRLEHPKSFRRIKSSFIQKIVKLEWPQAQVTIDGDAVSIVGEGKRFSEKELRQVFEKELPKNKNKKIVMEYASVLGDVWKSDDVQLNLQKDWWKNYVTTPQKMRVSSRYGQHLDVRLRLGERCLAWVAQKNLLKMSSLDEKDFRREWKPCRDQFIISLREDVVLKTNLQKDRGLKQRHLISKHALRRGDRKKVMFHSGSLTLSMFGIAQESGGPGDTVRFKSINNKKIVFGKIFPDGHVEAI